MLILRTLAVPPVTAATEISIQTAVLRVEPVAIAFNENGTLIMDALLVPFR